MADFLTNISSNVSLGSLDTGLTSIVGKGTTDSAGDDSDATTVQVSHVTGPKNNTKQTGKSSIVKSGMTTTSSGCSDSDDGGDSGVLLFEAANEDAVLADITEEQFQVSLRSDTEKSHNCDKESVDFFAEKKTSANVDSILHDLEAFEAFTPPPITEEREDTMPTSTVTSPGGMVQAAAFGFAEEESQQTEQPFHPHNIKDATSVMDDDSQEEDPEKDTNRGGDAFLQFNNGQVEARAFGGQELVLNKNDTDHSSSEQNSTDPVFMVGGRDIDEPLPYSSKKKFPKIVVLALLILTIVGLVSIVLGLVLGGSGNNEVNHISSSAESFTVGERGIEATQSPSDSATTQATTGATRTETVPPTIEPTTETTAELKIFDTDILPEYTKERLEDPASPQSRALDWLLHHPLVVSGNMAARRQIQLFALVTFYHSFGGPRWTYSDADIEWLDYQTSECEWRHSASVQVISPQGEFDTTSKGESDQGSITPCNSNGDYQALVLSGLFQQLRKEKEEEDKLSISIPPELSLLPFLKVIQLYDNNFPPLSSLLYLLPSPFQMADFEAIETFMIANEPDLTGPIPSELTLWKNLNKVVLVGTSLSGSLPPALGGISIQTLYLANNQLSGRIPVSLFSPINGSKDGASIQSSLRYLSLSGNSLTGAIPSEMGLITSLRELDLSENPFLSGSLPVELGTLVVPPEQTNADFNREFSGSLRYIDITGNERMSGKIPDELCHLNRKTTRALGCSYPSPIFEWYGPDKATRSCALNYDCTHLLCGCSCICSS